MSLSDVSLTSDKSYLQIAFEASTTMDCNGVADSDSTFPSDVDEPFGFSNSFTVTHDFGYVPIVRVFWDAGKNGRWYSSRGKIGNATDYIEPWIKILATATTVKFILNTDGTAQTNIPIFYRIYKLGSESTTTDERIDKIFKKESVSATVAASGISFSESTTTLALPHGQTAEVPIYTVQFSDDNSNWYSANSPIVGAFDTASGPPGGPYSQYFYTNVSASIDATNLYLVLRSNYPTTKTIYVRYTLDTRS